VRWDREEKPELVPNRDAHIGTKCHFVTGGVMENERTFQLKSYDYRGPPPSTSPSPSPIISVANCLTRGVAGLVGSDCPGRTGGAIPKHSYNVRSCQRCASQVRVTQVRVGQVRVSEVCVS
jgi:hypothetical protein